MSDLDVAAQWRLGSLSAYYDAEQEVVARMAQRLASTDRAHRAIAVTSIEVEVMDLTAELTTDAMARVAVSMHEDLYRVATSLMVWIPEVASYIRAVWGTFNRSLTSRGYRMHYVVDLDHRNQLGRPLELYPELFTAAGLTYICPQAEALTLTEADGRVPNWEMLSPLMDDARKLAMEHVDSVVEAGNHLFYLDGSTDHPSEIAPVVERGQRVGTILVLRSSAPEPGSGIQVAIAPPVPR